MRIKDLATRATKLLTGNAYMVFDNGTKVEKVDYAELAKQIITEYNTQTLAGSAQSVKSALDYLNSKIDEFYTKMLHSNEGTTVSFVLKGRGTVLAIGNDSGSRSWVAVISMHGSTVTGTIRMLVNDDDPSYNPVASFPSARNCTLTVHAWEDILLISTVDFA